MADHGGGNPNIEKRAICKIFRLLGQQQALADLVGVRRETVVFMERGSRHAKYVPFQLAEVAITQKLFTAILDRIERLLLPPPAIHGG